MKKKLFVSGKNLKKVTAALLAALLVLTMGFTSYAREVGNGASEGENPEESYVEQYNEDMSRVGGYINIPISKGASVQKRGLRSAKKENSFPEKYNSKEQEWAKSIKIKNQDKAGLCWSFTMTTCGEYSYAKEFGSTPEVSPGHLANFVHERVNDPLGNTGGDKNILMVPGHWSLTGSNYFCVMFNAGTWSGYGLEANTPYSVIDNNIQDGKWIGPSGSLYDAKYAYDDCMVVENLYFGVGAGQDLLKEWITSYGAVGVSVPFYGEFMNYANYALYPTDYWGDNHGVTIIGWDDTYPAKNFAHELNPDNSPVVDANGKELSKEEALEYTTPPGDGAWIVQNSWSEDWGYDGCFYLSYYKADSPFTSNAVAFDMMKADAYKYNFFYDGTAGTLDITDEVVKGFETVQGSKAANVFTNTTGEPITIDAVGYATFNTGICHYNVSIYTNLTDPANPESGTLAGGGSFTGSLVGPRTAALDTPARVEDGETYSVVFSFPEETAVFCLEGSYNNGMYEYDAEINAGQSFYKSADGQEWVDLAGKGACYRIKAFANPVNSGGGGNGGEGGDGGSEDLPLVDWEDPIYTAMAIAASEYSVDGIADIKGNFALSYGVMKYLEEHPNVTLRYKMTYKTNTYLVTIPGKDVVANPEIPWYGPEWLLTYFKWNPLPYEEFPS